MWAKRQGSLVTFTEAYTEHNYWDKLKYWFGHTNWSSWWSRAHEYYISAYEWCAVSIHFEEVFNWLPQSLSMVALFNANASNFKLCRSMHFPQYTDKDLCNQARNDTACQSILKSIIQWRTAHEGSQIECPNMNVMMSHAHNNQGAWKLTYLLWPDKVVLWAAWAL